APRPPPLQRAAAWAIIVGARCTFTFAEVAHGQARRTGGAGHRGGPGLRGGHRPRAGRRGRRRRRQLPPERGRRRAGSRRPPRGRAPRPRPPGRRVARRRRARPHRGDDTFTRVMAHEFEDVAYSVVVLAAEDDSYLTRQVLHPSGGWVMP